MWVEGLKLRNAFPTAHRAARLGLALDTAGIAKALADADTVLLVGGNFFEDVWYAPGGPFPDGAAVAQIEASPERLAYGVAPKAIDRVLNAAYQLYPESGDRKDQREPVSKDAAVFQRVFDLATRRARRRGKSRD